MQLFQYHRAASEAEATDLFKKHEGAQYIAGATNLLDLMKKGIAAPAHLIDISRLPLTQVTADDNGLTIGALALNSDVAEHELVRKSYKLLGQALLQGASPQLRNMATVGGNLLQCTRCPYFYDMAMPCNKRAPGSGCGAKDGNSRSAAIFGASESCVAVHPSDLCVALAALNAEVLVRNLAGQTRRVPIGDFHRLPGDTPHLDTNLNPGDLVLGVFVPKNPFKRYTAYLKIRDRASYAFALISVAIALDIKDGEIREARIALGGVAHKPWRLPEVEAFLKGKTDSEQTFKQAGELAIANAHALKDNAFKIKMVKNALVAAFNIAVS